ncbi:alkaline phosphatase family protein [Aminobacterium sp. UBA5514]|uniref:alkaline phosphatase family protein n=1 Tax=Aminobacterium sp. UBA5514 TaxID=1946036 RepID=UPI00257EE19F|nr:alkaline phosphatase family protein [Aminobacterium sp. UBA5514]
MRCILVILDGLGDKGLPALGGHTPLQVARTPNLDQIAAAGVCGLYHSCLQGQAMPSEMAHFVMFGYDLAQFPGRGYIEMRAEGFPVHSGDVALLSRTFSVKKEKEMFILKVEKMNIDKETLAPLHKAIRFYYEKGVEIEFIPTKGIAGLSIMRGPGLSAEITDSNPIYENRPIMKVLPRQDAKNPAAANYTAEILNKYLLWSYNILSNHPINKAREKEHTPPINFIGLQRAGQHQPLTPFSQKWGLKALCIASGAIYYGLCSTLGMDVLHVQDTEDPGKDLEKRLRLAYEAKGYDFIYVHTKATDEAAHERKPDLKIRVIEALDHAFKFARDVFIPDEDVLLVVTSDHSTASIGNMIHSGETVPIVMKGKYTRRDSVDTFDEISCALGGLGILRQHELMYMILNLLDRGKLGGLMDSPVDQPYYPGPYIPLKG